MSKAEIISQRGELRSARLSVCILLGYVFKVFEKEAYDI
jgi:hypothetical protein